ncbi:lon, partial [Symbiodinium sp. CCMP2592]
MAHSPEACTGLVEGANLVIAVLNDLHRGQDGGGGQPLLSAAHRRVHARIVCALEAMVVTDEPLLSSEGLDSFLKQSEHYSGSGVVLALGVKGGVPSKAADVPLEQHLQSTFPEMAEQVVRPNALLLLSRRRPRHVKRGYTWLARSYPELVQRNVRAGLHCLKRRGQVARHRGALCLAGAFAVKKDEHEDRVITDPSVNQLLDPDKLPRPQFAFIPKMRSLTVPEGGVVVVSKRDARHYFHRLKIGRRWRRWLCGPPIQIGRGAGPEHQRFPASCSVPMGFGPSAGWAQGLTDTVTQRAGLPSEHRLHPDMVVPECLPLWGSIVDDVWAIEHAATQLDAGVGAAWMDSTESSWVQHGVEPNAKKSVDSALGEEVQGYYVDPHGHWVGVSLEKRRHLFQATVHVLRARKVPVGVRVAVRLWLVGICEGTKARPETADAATWAAEDRLRRPVDEGCRFVHPLDSAACAGCLSKGRSSSFQLNSRCRRMCAINVAGGHDVFYPWMPSKENPADEPSRRWEPATHTSSGQVWLSPDPTALSEVDVSQVNFWPRDACFFLHLCSGPRSQGDLCECVEKLGALHEINIIAIRIDPRAVLNQEVIWGQKTVYGDLLEAQLGLFLLVLIQSGKVIGGFASPPCQRRLLQPIGGAIPLQSRDDFGEPSAFWAKSLIREVGVDWRIRQIQAVLEEQDSFLGGFWMVMKRARGE